MGDYPTEVLDTFEFLAVHFANVFYNELYGLAKSNVASKQKISSLTVEYKGLLLTYNKHMDKEKQQFVDSAIGGVKRYYETYTQSVVTTNSCISRITSAFVPEDYISSLSQTMRLSIMYTNISNVVLELLTKIYRDEVMLRQIIDKRNNENMSQIKDLIVRMLLVRRDQIYKDFAKAQTGTEGSTLLADMKAELAEYKKKYTELEAQHRKMTVEMRENQELLSRQGKIISQELEKHKAQMRKLQDRNQEMSEELSDVQGRYRTTLDELETARGRNSSLSKELSTAQDALYETKRKLQESSVQFKLTPSPTPSPPSPQPTTQPTTQPMHAPVVTSMPELMPAPKRVYKDMSTLPVKMPSPERIKLPEVLVPSFDLGSDYDYNGHLNYDDNDNSDDRNRYDGDGDDRDDANNNNGDDADDDRDDANNNADDRDDGNDDFSNILKRNTKHESLEESMNLLKPNVSIDFDLFNASRPSSSPVLASPTHTRTLRPMRVLQVEDEDLSNLLTTFD